MSKPMLVTLPFILLLLDYWPLNRLETAGADARFSGIGRLLREKIPFFVLSLASSIVTFWAQQKGGAVASLDHIPLLSRLVNGIISYGVYLAKTIWPTNLAVLYLPPAGRPAWQTILVLVVLAALTAGAIWGGRLHRFLPVGWFWFLGMLIPVIGIVQVGSQSMADRYTYLPLIGLFLAISWGSWELARHQGKAALTLVGLLVTFGLAARTSDQLRCWTDGEALFTHCVETTPDNYVAQSNLGNALAGHGKYSAAKSHYLEALRLQPQYANAMRNLGVLLTQQGQTDEALEYLRQATRLAPDTSAIYARLALALSASGNTESAILYYHESLLYFPDQVEVCNNLAWIRATHPDPRLRDGKEAVLLAERACVLTDFNTAILLGTLAAAYAESGRFSEATETAQKAVARAAAAGDRNLENRNRELLALYQSNKPYREPAPGK
jgi:tetratricopeptide (TPR) repeat protein